MARKQRTEFAGAHYHVISRGNAKAPIFLDDDDRQLFMCLLAKVVRQSQWELLAYCLMPNHYHLFLATPEPSLARGMQQLNGIHAQRFNRRYARVGHVFQGRYKAILVDTSSYLLTLLRYIVLNPVRAGLCQVPDEWPWSSHAVMVGRVPVVVPLKCDRVLAEFGGDPEVGLVRYSDFIAEGLISKERLRDFTNPLILSPKK
jgi:putative transposase